jgi:hypothetical protein
LKRLTFYSEVIPAQTFLVIAEIPQVEQLDLVTPTLDADALSQLIATPHIRRLRLVRWQGGDTELQGLAKMPGLTHLILESTTVTAAGTQKFHEARPDVSIGGDFNLPGKRN